MTRIPSGGNQPYPDDHGEIKPFKQKKDKTGNKTEPAGGYLEGMGERESFIENKKAVREGVSKKPKHRLPRENLARSSTPDTSETIVSGALDYLSGMQSSGSSGDGMGSSSDYADARSGSSSDSFESTELPELAQGNVVIDKGKLLGSGGFGEGVSRQDEKICLIRKVVESEKNVAAKKFTNRMERELFVIDQLVSRKVEGTVRLYGKLVNDRDYSTHLVMKYCNKGPVSNYFEDHAGDELGSYEMLLTLMQKVEGFHKGGFCHRDIHEGNFLSHLKKDGRLEVYLTDFGHATLMDADGANINPLEGRGVHKVNSPPVFSSLYDEAVSLVKEEGLESDAYKRYESYAYEKGKELDNYQLGMMIFRVCLACAGKGAAKTGGVPNDAQLSGQIAVIWQEVGKEVEKLPASASEERREKLEADLIGEKIADYISQEFHEVPGSMAKVIAGLLSFPRPMPISTAIHKIQDYLSHH